MVAFSPFLIPYSNFAPTAPLPPLLLSLLCFLWLIPLSQPFDQDQDHDQD